MPPPVPYVGNTSIIPYIPAGLQPPLRQRNPNFSNIVKTFANQNVCFTCSFDVEDWHMSTTCNRKKPGHQDGFTRSNYMECKCANHPFCRNAMHKTMHPSSFQWCGAVIIDVKSLKSVTQFIHCTPSIINHASPRHIVPPTTTISQSSHQIVPLQLNTTQTQCKSHQHMWLPTLVPCLYL